MPQHDEILRLRQLAEITRELCHDLAQPLTSISNYAGASENVLTSSAPDAKEKAVAWIGRILEETRRAGESVDRVRDQLRRHDEQARK